jgi:predicted nucleotidyltransferase
MADSVVPSSSVPPSLLEAVVTYFHPRRVILFGSLAHGNAGPDSDIDLVVELDDDAPPERMSAKAIQAAREGYHNPVDIIPYRASVLASRARAIGSFAYTVLRDGVTLYERT